ncbi:hypothetical protein N7463_007879 [Penicillium fimorum]|uniref:Ankyrin n=1 Tax=Penicillium fimorum TaxID=1882269 RepID=A0A9W9XYQ3_9EURO|nr:hypothetical protein N7463_007879 [Penicillium fimorum]
MPHPELVKEYDGLTSGNDEVVQIVDDGANINTQGVLYGNLLQAAASGGSAKVVRMLLNDGADVDTQGGKYGSALQAAASSGRAEVVQILLDADANVNT